MYQNSTPLNRDIDKVNAFNNHFYSVFNKDSTDLPSSDLQYLGSLCHITITEAEVYNTLVRFDISKAMGPDGILPIVLSKCASALYKPLHYLFNLALCFGYLPCEWKVHKIVPVFKSGDPSHLNNYWPISLLSNTSKYWNEYSMTNLLGTLPVVLHQLNLDLSRIIHQCSNFFYFYLIVSPRVTSWILFIWTLLKHLILSPIHVYFINLVCSTLGVNSSHGFWCMLPTGLNLYPLMDVTLISFLGVPLGSILGPLLYT